MFLRIVSLFVVLSALLSQVCYAESILSSTSAYYKQFQEVFERINKDYVQDPDKQKMTDAALNGMLMSLDPHSGYYTDEDLEDFQNQTKGEFGGIGVEIMYDNGAIKVISPIDDLPASRAGIKTGDYIVGVNDELVVNLGFNKAVREMRGNPGTKVKLMVVKDEETKPQEIELTREIVKLKPIKAHLEDGNIAYIRIVTFNEHTTEELKKAFDDLEKQIKGNNSKENVDSKGRSDKINGIILDLRNNPGGLLNQAVSVSEYFIDSGIVVSTKGRASSSNSVMTASKSSEKAPKVPIVVIINSGSASASEIVAGCLQDHKRAIIIGTKSFGKGSVQTFMQINHRAAIKMTTAKYYTPSGRSIQAEGIEPDIIIEPAKVDFTYKSEKNRFSESSLKNYLKNDNPKEKSDNVVDKEKSENLAKQINDLKAPKLEENQMSELYKKDYQFARGYDLIRGIILSNKNSISPDKIGKEGENGSNSSK